jgi:hypothetical protein
MRRDAGGHRRLDGRPAFGENPSGMPHRIPPQRFDHNRSVHDIDTSITGEPNPAGHGYKVSPIAIETKRWRQTWSDRHMRGRRRVKMKRSAVGR